MIRLNDTVYLLRSLSSVTSLEFSLDFSVVLVGQKPEMIFLIWSNWELLQFSLEFWIVKQWYVSVLVFQSEKVVSLLSRGYPRWKYWNGVNVFFQQIIQWWSSHCFLYKFQIIIFKKIWYYLIDLFIFTFTNLIKS